MGDERSRRVRNQSVDEILDIAVPSPKKIIVWGLIGVFSGLFGIAFSAHLLITNHILADLLSVIRQEDWGSALQSISLWLLIVVILMPVVCYGVLCDGMTLILSSNKEIYLRAGKRSVAFRIPIVEGKVLWKTRFCENEIPSDMIVSYQTKTGGIRPQYPPLFDLVVLLKDNSAVVIDCLYFKESLDEIIENLNRVFNAKGDVKNVMMVRDEIRMLKELDDGDPVLDGQGRFIPPK